MEQQMQNDEIEIDLREIFFVLRRKLLIIILCIIIGGGTMAAYTIFLVTPQYASSSMLYILSKTTSVTSLADIQLGSQLTNDYAILVKSRPVLNNVIDNLNLNTEYDELLNTVKVENPTNTRILYITVENPVPEMAQKIADEIAVVTADRMADVMATEKPSIGETATLPKEPVSPSLKKNCAIGALLGMLLSMAVIVLMYMMDDTIKSEEDIEKYLGLTTLTLVPLQSGLDKGEKRRSRKRRKKPDKQKQESEA